MATEDLLCYNSLLCQRHSLFVMSDINCESCGNFIYDEEYEEYYCQMELDEDEYGRLVQDSNYKCPYFIFNDEYKIVRHQM